MTLRTDSIESRRQAQIERRLNEIGSMVKGNQAFQSDRISDVIEQIDELRKELLRIAERQDKIAERQDKIAEFVKEKLGKKTTSEQ